MAESAALVGPIAEAAARHYSSGSFWSDVNETMAIARQRHRGVDLGSVSAQELPGPKVMSILRGLYKFREETPGEIEEFLTEHDDLVPVLREAHERLPHFFPGAVFALEYLADPEEEDDEGHLVLYVAVAQGVREGLKSLDRMDLEWWLKKPFAVRNGLSINVEFR